MIKNYLRVAFRNLRRNKSFSIINIGGLAFGMASAILILLWIQNEVSHDRFHKKLNRLYEVWSNDKIDGSIRSLTNTPEIMAPSLKKDYPEIEEVTRLSWTRNLLGINDDKKLLSTGAVVDAGFFNMFSFPLLKGNSNTVFHDPHAMVVTQKLAKKLFNDEDPIGKIVRMGNSENYTVTGLLKDLPNNTQFDFIEYLVSYELRTLQENIDKDWGDISISTFVLLKPNSSSEELNAKLKNIIPQHTSGFQKTEEFVYPVKDLWLYSQFENGKATGGRITIVKTFIIIAIFILLIACINFMNLSTARSEKRAKEVGVRKVAGALKRSLVFQFLCESLVITFIAGLLAIAIIELALPSFNTLIGKRLAIEYDNFYFWLAGFSFIFLTGTLAGSYPAFFLSEFKPISVLKGSFKKINALVTPRKILVVLQFTFAIILIICTIIITQQVKYAQSRKAGYERDHLVHIYTNDEMDKHFGLIKNELISSGAAIAVSKVQAPLTQNWSSGIHLDWEGKDPSQVIQINRYTEESDLVKTAGMELITGRDIDIKNYPSDSTACLINESAFKLMKFKNPIGQTISDDPQKWHVIGVIKDFIQESPYQPVKPMIIRGPKEWMGVILVRLNSRPATAENLSIMEKIFKKYNPAYPFEYTFTDEEYTNKFANEQLTKKLAALFAWLTIFISCLGLFGLAAYMAESRTKEIGIRKTLGASVINITTMLSLNFMKLVAAAIIIATPVAWWAMNSWLKDYDYRIRIHWWVFALAGSLSLLIALITVSYESIKAAIANPVKSLRTE
jgi:ABC-type antimicrobial peptide transport system permease subunit